MGAAGSSVGALVSTAQSSSTTPGYVASGTAAPFTLTPTAGVNPTPTIGSGTPGQGIYACSPYPENTGYQVCVLPNNPTYYCNVTSGAGATAVYSCNTSVPSSNSERLYIWIGVGFLALIAIIIIIVLIIASRNEKDEAVLVTEKPIVARTTI